MSKKTAMEQLLGFQLFDDHVNVGNEIFFLYRYFPPNISIMTDDEIAGEIAEFARLLDTLRRPFSIFATDKTEDLSDVRRFYESLPPQFDYITTDILSSIEDTEVKSTSVQRAFYFIYKAENEEDDIYNLFAGRGYRIEKADKREISILLRNYLLREFVTTDIYDITQEVADDPKLKKAKQKVRDREVLRRLLPQGIFFNQRHAVQNDFLRKTIMVKNFPNEIPACSLLELASLRGTSFNLRLTPMPGVEARKLTDAQLNNRKVLFGSKRDTDKIDAGIETDVIREFYATIARNKNVIYRLNVFIEMYGRDEKELAEILADVESALIGRGITHDKLSWEQREAFKSVWPLGKDLFASSSNNMPSTTAAALYPCSYSFRMDAQGMYLGQTVSGGNIILDIWQRDANITNSNYVIIGTSGQGKTYLQKKIITMQYVRGTVCFVLDPENEYTELTRQLDGTVVNCASGNVKINPFHVRAMRTDEDDSIDDDLNISVGEKMFFQHLSWLQDFFHVLLKGLSDNELKALGIFVQDMYTAHGIDENTNFDELAPTDYPTFSDLYAQIEKHAGKDHPLVTKEQIKTLLLNLRDCATGSLGALFNGHTNIKNDRLMCFSVAELIQGSQERTQAVLFNITTYIWSEICKKRLPAMFNIDELYIFLDKENMTMVKYINFFVKRARKYNALIGIATQQIADCLYPEIEHYTTALFNNAATKFLFYPDKIDLSIVKEKLKLTDGEIRCIDHSNQRHCLLKAGNDRYYLKVGSLPYERELFGRAGGR